MSSADVIEFLKARLDEIERIAVAASAGGRWYYSGSDTIGAWTLYDEDWRIADLVTYRYDDDVYDYKKRMPEVRHPKYIDVDANGKHIAHHDPARVLAEVESKRRVLRAHEKWCAGQCEADAIGPNASAYLLDGAYFWMIKVHAAIYNEHPDYQQEWTV